MIAGWRLGIKWYVQRADYHRPLHDKISSIFRMQGFESLLEVGGGIALFAPMVKRYVGIEWNMSAARMAAKTHNNATMIVDNWLNINPDQFANQFDAFMALAVIEHCPVFEDAIDKALRTLPRYAFISFFMGLSEDSSHKYGMKRQTGNDAPVPYNQYSRKLVCDYLDQHALCRSYELIDLPQARMPSKRDTLLIIETTRT